MFVFLRETYFSEKIVEKIKKLNLTPIIYFYIEIEENLNLKQEVLNNIEKDSLKYKSLNFKTAICVQLPKNTTKSSKVEKIFNTLNKNFTLIILKGGLNSINKFVLEIKEIFILQDPQNSTYENKFDFIHHLNLGLNHIFLKQMSKQNKFIYFSLNFLSKYLNNFEDEKENTKNFQRIKTIISLAEKYKVPIILSYTIYENSQIKDFKQYKNIFPIFNLSSKFNSYSQEKLEETFNFFENKKKGKILKEGFETSN